MTDTMRHETTHPPPTHTQHPNTTTTEYARAARNLNRTATQLELKCPSFRSPPQLLTDRSIRWSHGRAIVSVRLGRPPDAVFADMVDGVLAANRRTGNEVLRAQLLEACR